MHNKREDDPNFFQSDTTVDSIHAKDQLAPNCLYSIVPILARIKLSVRIKPYCCFSLLDSDQNEGNALYE